MTPFLHVGGAQGRYCVVFDSRQNGRLNAHEKVCEAGDNRPLTAHASHVFLVRKKGFPSSVCRPSPPSLCWGRWRGNKYTFHSPKVIRIGFLPPCHLRNRSVLSAWPGLGDPLQPLCISGTFLMQLGLHLRNTSHVLSEGEMLPFGEGTCIGCRLNQSRCSKSP